MKKLISKSDLASATQLQESNPILSLLSGIAGIEKVNKLYGGIAGYTEQEFIEKLFETLEIEVEIDENDLKNIPVSGPFITVSNHPFGAIDGLMLLYALRKRRNDFKVLANFLLQHVEPIKELFIAVNPFEERRGAFSNLSGLKLARKHLEAGGGLGIFPAGEVSSFQPDGKGISDKKWMQSALKIIQRAEVPVLPVYFDGSNSYMFHLLGLLHPGLRTLTLPSEMMKKKGKKIRMRIGKPVSVKDQADFENIEQYGRFLRAKTYALGTSLEVKRDYFRLLRFPSKPAEIVPAQAADQLLAEIERIQSFKLFDQDSYSCFLAPSREIPGILNEIGRLREITFRAVGEGTNRSIDLDEYDIYYRHLFLWDNQQQQLVGAYRIGMGEEIMQKFGSRGFYTSSLFKLKSGLDPYLQQAIELGRSFILKEYQQKRLPLFLLWKGILLCLMNHPNYRYLIGPVSISSSYQEFSKGLIIEFVRKYHYDEELAQFVKPRHAFRIKSGKVDQEALINATKSDLKKLDKIISDIEPSAFTIPILLKKYLLQNARIIGFNRDPKFNNALDGLILLDLHNIPAETIENLKKEFNNSLGTTGG